MARKKAEESKLVEVVRDLDEQLNAFEQLAEAAQRTPLNSERNISRAAKAVNEAAAAQQRIAVGIGALSQALQEARAQNEKTANALSERGAEIQRRSDELTAMLARFQELGRQAGEISAQIKGASGGKPVQAMLELKALDGKLGEIIDAAAGVAKDAGAVQLDELANQADGLRQQLLAARNKLGLLIKRFEAVQPETLN